MAYRAFKTAFVIGIVTVLLSALPSAAYAALIAGGGVAPTPGTVIVQVADASHMAAVRAQLQKDGATVAQTYRWNAYVVSVPTGTDPTKFSSTARGISGVKFAQDNGTVHALATTSTSDPKYPQQWGLPDIGAPTAWTMSQGAGVSVAVIDTGVDSTQPDLVGQVVLFKNYVTSGASAADDNGHGTHVSGIIAAIRNNGIEGSGTAPKAKIYAFKVLDATGSGSDASVAAAIRDAVDLTPCRIISMSLGGPVGSGGDPVLASAVSYAQSKGAIVIAAAGNDGTSTASYPAALPDVIGVGAVDSFNALASFSNYGSADLDVVAPGVNILSTIPGSTMQSWAGTSMATPFVSGAAALVWSAHPELTATQLANVLESTAQDLGAAGVDTRYGHGLVRPDLALAALGKPTPTPTPVPTPTPAPTSSPAPTTTPSPSTTPTPPPAVGSSLTIAVGSSSIRLGKATSLRGLLTPGSVHDVVRVYVIKPGAHTWSIWKTLYASSAVGAGGTRWSYTFKPTKRGTYKVRVRFLGNAVVLASASRTLSVRVR